MSIFPTLTYWLTLNLFLGLYFTTSQAMEKETLQRDILFDTGPSSVSLTYNEMLAQEDKSLKRIEVIKDLIERSAHQLKIPSEASGETLHELKKINKCLLRGYQQASKVMEKAQYIYKLYTHSLCQAYKTQASVSGFNLIRYVKLLACANELDIINQEAKDPSLSRYAGFFKEFVNDKKQFFTDEERYWSDFLNMQGPTDIRLSSVQIEYRQARQMRNINNILHRINLDKFTFNHSAYRALVAKYLHNVKIDKSVISSYRAMKRMNVHHSRVNLVTSNGFSFPALSIHNQKVIDNIYWGLFNIVNFRFHNGHVLSPEFYHLYPVEECVMLSDQQRDENYPILFSMLTAATALTIDKPVHPDTRVAAKRKKAAKSQRKKNQASHNRALARTHKLGEEKVKSQHDEESEALHDTQPEVAAASSSPSSQGQILLSMSESETHSQEESLKDPLLECKAWLQDIMKRSFSQQGEHFSIFRKAHSLLKDLEKNNELVLLAVQEATCTLAERLNGLANREDIHEERRNYIPVPKNYEYDYLLFMDTPITYLHSNIRFGMVRRLVKGLGGKIDDGRNGSRINLVLNNAHTSIHLHDAHNGLLDAGRIFSLRKFFIEAGVCVDF